MSAPDLPRYVVRHYTGQTLVLDTWTLCRVVLAISHGKTGPGRVAISAHEAGPIAESVCEGLNAEHEAWLAA